MCGCSLRTRGFLPLRPPPLLLPRVGFLGLVFLFHLEKLRLRDLLVLCLLLSSFGRAHLLLFWLPLPQWEGRLAMRPLMRRRSAILRCTRSRIRALARAPLRSSTLLQTLRLSR